MSLEVPWGGGQMPLQYFFYLRFFGGVTELIEDGKYKTLC